MNRKQRLQSALSHRSPDRVPVDFGGTAVTGIHVLAVSKLREYFGLEKRPVKVIEPYQMLGEVDDELKEVIGVDTAGITPRNNMFGFPNENWKEFRMPWGQVVLVPEKFNTTREPDGSLLLYPEGETSAPASAKMPAVGYFFDAIIRQEPIDDSRLNPEDNLQEFSPISEEDLLHWRAEVEKHKDSDLGIIASFGGTAFGDIALVPAIQLKHPKGIRDIVEWYVSTLIRRYYIHAVFDKQCDIALKNLKKIFDIVGNKVEAQVLENCEIFSKNGGFVFNAVHNIQANVPVENIAAMVNAVRKFNGQSPVD
jgi:hypothetical protein